VELIERYTVYACVVGSRAYGLAETGSDTDRRGVFCPPTALFWHLDKPPTHLDGPVEEQFSWELERFCVLALQANPTVLECLWSPLVSQCTDVGAALLAVRSAFLSRRVAETYGNYAADQLARIDARRRRTGEVNGKQAMHMIRLLLAGAHVLATGGVLVDVSAHRDELLAVKHGQVPWSTIAARADELTSRLSAALDRTGLPAAPDRAAVDAFLVATRRAMVPA
jgi:predicted nucleotidyltransferase